MDRTLVASILAMVVWACGSQTVAIRERSEPQTASAVLPFAGDLVADRQDLKASPDDILLSETCIFRHLERLVMQADAKTLRVADEVEVGDCVETVADGYKGASVDYHHTIRVFLEFTCPQTDLMIYDGLTLGEFRRRADHPCRLVGEGTARHQLEHEILSRKRYVLDGREIVSEVGGKIFEANMGDDATACEVKTEGSLLRLSNCKEIKRDVMTHLQISIDGVKLLRHDADWQLDL